MVHDDVFAEPAIKQPTILSVYNQKGGVGKTTTAVNLGLALAALGKRVVLIDFDPQSSASTNFVMDDKSAVGIHDLLNHEAAVEDAVRPTAFAGLSMIVGARKLYTLEHALDTRGQQQRGLRKALHFSADPPDYIVIDCPPALGHLAAGALAASDRIVLPVFPGRYAVDGLRKTLSVVEHIQKGLNPNLKVAGVLMLSVTNDEVGRESFAQLRDDFGELLFRTAIPYDVDVVKATYRRMPALVYNPKSRSSARFVALAWEVAQGRGAAIDEPALQKALVTVDAWREANEASYAPGRPAESPSTGSAGGGAGGDREPRRGAAALYVLVGGAIGLAGGFVAGALYGPPVLRAALAALGY